MKDETMDQLNEALHDVEDALVARGFNVTADVALSIEGHTLKWSKIGAEWLLSVDTSHNGNVPLLKASRIVRIASAEALPKLFDALTVVRDATNMRARDAIGVARETIRMIERYKP